MSTRPSLFRLALMPVTTQPNTDDRQSDTFQYPPQCCDEERKAMEIAGAKRFAADYHAGWRSRTLWKLLVSALRQYRAPFRFSFATGYARAVRTHADASWDMDVFVQSALEAASIPLT